MTDRGRDRVVWPMMLCAAVLLTLIAWGMVSVLAA